MSSRGDRVLSQGAQQGDGALQDGAAGRRGPREHQRGAEARLSESAVRCQEAAVRKGAARRSLAVRSAQSRRTQGGKPRRIQGASSAAARDPPGGRCLLQLLFLDDAKVKNFITCFKDQQFLVFFFKQLKLNRSGRYEDSFPYLSPCGREHNYVRCDDRPVVFTHLLQGASGEQLSYCGGGDRLAVPFQPPRLAMLPENGRVYHPGPEKAGGVGLVKSALAFELSPCFEYEQGPSRPPTHFRWQGKRHPLTNELLRLIQGEAAEGGA